jgi:hypothetical protein
MQEPLYGTSTAENPALQRHLLFSLLPATLLVYVGHDAHELAAVKAVAYIPASHMAQELEPAIALYWPAGHAKQRPPRGPVYPELQRQSVMTLLPGSEIAFTAQLVFSVPIPTSRQKNPGGHGAQEDDSFKK